MTILVTCGIHDEWCTFAQGRFESMGFGAPIASSRSHMSAAELTEKMAAVSRPRGKTSYKGAAPELGQAWQLAAADLMIANADQESWGWAHPDNLRFLEFWKAFEPNCRFALIYTSPAEYIAREISVDDVENDGLDEIITRWRDYHEEMLRFYHANSDVSMLINLHNFEDTAQSVATLLSDRLNLNATRLNQAEYLFQSALMDVIAERLIDQELELANLFSELENSADLPMSLSAYSRRGLASKAHKELDENLTGLDQAQSNLLDAHREIDQLNQSLEVERREREALEAAAAEAHVPQLLEKQLEQVREELHLYFNKYNELKAQIAAGEVSGSIGAFARTALPIASTLQIDLKSYIDGDGWHHAEDQGRWAGASLSSTLRLPDLEAGKYTVSVRIVDTMALDILRGMSLTLNGAPLNANLKILSDMGGRLAPLRRAKAHASNIEKPLPATLSATIEPIQIRIRDDNILGIVSPRAVYPPSVHGHDDRLLSCCIESVSFHRVV
ncbi:MAG: hypothetical protein HRT80_01030 [Henriciella sp.]|nr:hypothetical protein [Henriciella sp.]